MQSIEVPGWRRMMDEGTRVPYEARLARARAPDDDKVMATPGELGGTPPERGATHENTRGGDLVTAAN